NFKTSNAKTTQESLPSTMSGQTSGGEAGPPSRSNQRTFLDDVVLTFSSPMAWLLVVALVLTWSGVAIVLFDLLDYKTLAGNNYVFFKHPVISYKKL
uniref:Triadin n=1 Tax=Poecilia latipinna TaxID=48699 RepID=A0A3B3TXJ3_9TELE